MTNYNEASAKLYQQFKEYHLKDLRWQNNFIGRCRRLAQKISAKTLVEDEVFAMMRLDIIALRTGRNIPFQEED